MKINSFTLHGIVRVTDNKPSKAGKPIAKFYLESKSGFAEREKSIFISMVAFNITAQIVLQNDGYEVLVMGDFDSHEYQEKHYTDLIARSVYPAGLVPANNNQDEY